MGCANDSCVEYLNYCLYDIDTVLPKAFNEDWAKEHNGEYTYLICITELEKAMDPVRMLMLFNEVLSGDGHLLLGMNNRFGIRYFCGDRDPYTDMTMDGPDNYLNTDILDESGYKGRMYDRSGIEKMLREAGFRHYRFLSVLPDLRNPFRLVADSYIPNEDLTNRVTPAYNYPFTVFLEEERMYESLKENGLLHRMSNAFLIECAIRDELSDALYVTTSVERSRKNAMVTVVYGNGTVYKKSVYKEGNERILRLKENMDNLSQKGLNVIPTYYKDEKIVMPVIEAETGLQHFSAAYENGMESLLKEIDCFMDLIRGSSDIIRNDELLGPIVREGYFELVPQNSFYVNGEYVFFDQEYCIEEYPLNVILARVLFSFFAFHRDRMHIVNELFERYGLLEKKELYQKKELEFLDYIRQDSLHRDYYKWVRRDDYLTGINRLWMNYPGGWYHRHFIDIFDGFEGKKCYMFGSGKYAEDFIQRYGGVIDILGVFDNEASKWGRKFFNLIVFSPTELEEMDPDSVKIFVCMKDYKSVEKQLDEMRVLNYGIYIKGKKYPLPKIKKQYHIGYVAGAFDMFHIGHLNLLRRAKESCDYLIAGVISDERLYELKRKKPVIPCNERMQVVAGCRYVDRVEELPLGRAGIMDAYNMFHFDCMFSGDDHAGDPGWLADRDRLRKLGSDIQFVSYTKETSSSAIREKMKKEA